MIVTRGLGRGTIGALVAGGLGVALSIIVVPPTQFDRAISVGSGGGDKGRLVELATAKTRATVSLSAVKAKSLLYLATAKGGAKVCLVDLQTGSMLHTLEAAGASKSVALLVNESSQLGQVFAKGVQDLSDEEIAMLILATLAL